MLMMMMMTMVETVLSSALTAAFTSCTGLGVTEWNSDTATIKADELDFHLTPADQQRIRSWISVAVGTSFVNHIPALASCKKYIKFVHHTSYMVKSCQDHKYLLQGA